jgi:glycosyltransferase involved in cell wall biosynthesis
VVVDDGSRDGSHAVAEAMGARCLRLPAQRGPAHARNRGAEVARGDVLFFVDADVALCPDAVGQVTEAFRAEPGLAAVFGSYDDAPAAPNFLSQYKNLLHHFVHQNSTEAAWTFWAGCGAVRRDVFAAVGGFDEKYLRPSIEDIELGDRLRRQGHEIRLRKTLQGKHLKRWTPVSLLRADIRDRALPWAALLATQGQVANDLNLRWSSRISAVAAGALVVAIASAWLWPVVWLVAAALAALLVVLNLPLYAFFRRKRGLGFALGCLPWHWLYFLYSGAVFALVYGIRLRPRAGGGGGARA